MEGAYTWWKQLKDPGRAGTPREGLSLGALNSLAWICQMKGGNQPGYWDLVQRQLEVLA